MIKQQNEILIMIDNNSHQISKIKKIMNTKIFNVEIIFTKSSIYKKILKKYNFKLEYLYNPKYYWELEGIKFYNKN